MTTLNIPQEHIDRLMQNPAEAALFDQVYGTGASNKYLQEVETTKDERELEPVKGITKNVVIGAKEAIRETLQTLEGLSDVAEENIPLGGFKFGSEANNGFIEYVNPTELKKINEVEDQGLFQTAADVIPESGEAEGVTGNLARGVSQFVTGFVGGGTVLKSLGWARNASKGYNVTRSFVQGGIADFAVFDEKEERLADFIIEAVPSAQETFIEYLAADEEDTFMEGKMKNVLEGVMLGGVAEVLFKTIRMMRGTRKRLDAGDEKGAKEFAEKEAKEIDEGQTKIADEVDGVDPVEQAGKGKRGIPDADKKKKNFNMEKSLRGSDFFKNTKELIKRIRLGEADIEDLDEIPVSINFIDDVDEAATLVRIISQEVNKLTKEFDEVQTHDMVWKQADRMLEKPSEALAKAQELAKVTDKQPAITVAMRVVFNGLYQRVQRQLNLIQQGKGSEEELDSALDILQAFYRLDRQIGKNTGRSLEIRKLMVGSESKATKKIKNLLEEADVRPEEGRIELKKKIKQVKDKKGVIAVLKAAQEKLGINFINKFWINALLSNPKTHAINMTSNTIMALIRPMEQYMGGVLTRDKSARIEAVATAAGIIKYFQDALQMSRVAYKQSDSILDKKNFKVDLPENTFNKKANIIERKVIEAPTRFLNAEDEMFKQLNYRAKVYGMAVAEGLRKGLSKKKTHFTSDGRKYSELDKFIEDKFDEAFNPDFSGKNKVALEYAQENTFTKALGQGTLGKTVQSAVNQVPILRQIMPFVRTPVNIARAVWDRSPLGIFRKKFREELFSPDKSIRASAVGKQTMGGALFASSLVLAWNGMITGGVPKDKNLRRQKFDAGWRPYSFKVGDKYISYERLDPFGMFFGLVADYAAIANEVTAEERQELADANMMALLNQMEIGDYSEIAAGGVLATAKNLSSKTYIKSLTDFISAFASGDPREVKRYGLTKAGSFVPNIVKGIANDPLYRETRTLTDTLKSRVGLYGDIDPSFNVLGEARSKGQSWWESFLLPFNVTEGTEDNIVKELDRLNQSFAPIGTLQGFNSNIDISKFTKGDKNAFVRYNELLSENGNLRRDLERLISSPGYAKLSDNPISESQSYKGSKQAAIKNIINKYKRRAKAKLIREGFITSENLNLADAFRNDKKNQRRAERGFTLLPTE